MDRVSLYFASAGGARRGDGGEVQLLHYLIEGTYLPYWWHYGWRWWHSFDLPDLP